MYLVASSGSHPVSWSSLPYVLLSLGVKKSMCSFGGFEAFSLIKTVPLRRGLGEVNYKRAVMELLYFLGGGGGG